MAKQPAAKSAFSQSSLLAKITDWHCIGILALLVIVFFRKILFGEAYLWEDFLYSSYPARVFAATSLARGEIPLWNPYTFGGMPFLADIITATFYLPTFPLVLFVSNGHLNFYWLELMVILHYLLAGTTMYYLGKSFGLQYLPSLFAGISYMLTGFMVVHAIHQPVVTLAAWIPLIVLLFRRTLIEVHWKWVFLTALVLGHSILAGFPQLSLYIYFFLFLLFLFELLTTYSGRALLSRPALSMASRAGVAIVLSVMLAMVQLLPTIELSEMSQRAEITYQFATEGSLAWPQLPTLLFPKLFGSAGAGGYNYWGPGRYFYYWETCIYLGVIPFLLMLLSVFHDERNKYVPFLWGVGLFALLFALGNNFVVHRVFFSFVPGFSRFRNPARIGILLAFAAVILSAFSFQHLLYDQRSQRENNRLQRVLVLVSVMVIGAAFWFIVQSGAGGDAFSFLHDKQAASMVAKELNLSLGLLVVSGGLILMLLRRAAWSRWAGFLVIGAMFVDLYLFGSTQNNSPVSPTAYFARSEQLVNFLRREGEGEIFRLNTRNADGMIMDRNQGMIDRIFLMEGYSPLTLQRLNFPMGSSDRAIDLLNIKYKTVTDRQRQALSLVKNETYLPRAFFVYSTHVVHSENELLEYIKSPSFDHRTTAVLEKDPEVQLAPPLTTPTWKAHITSYSINAISLDVETSHNGFLLLSEMYFPGWNAYIDGKQTEIFQTDYNLRGIFVSAGSHKIEVRFEPESFRKGVILTIASLLVCSTGLVISTRSKRKGAHHAG